MSRAWCCSIAYPPPRSLPRRHYRRLERGMKTVREDEPGMSLAPPRRLRAAQAGPPPFAARVFSSLMLRAPEAQGSSPGPAGLAGAAVAMFLAPARLDDLEARPG